MNPKVDAFLNREKKWPIEMTKLRTIMLDCKLTEALKWGVPCYTVDGSNVVLIHGFKEYCAVLFMKGALLKDTKQILIQQTANVQSARQIRFTSVQEITKLEPIIKAYIKEAINIEKAGLKVDFIKPDALELPDEFAQKLKAMPSLKKAFNALTPGRQRAYILHFSSPKQTQTRVSRIEKCIPFIFDGKGLND